MIGAFSVLLIFALTDFSDFRTRQGVYLYIKKFFGGKVVSLLIFLLAGYLPAIIIAVFVMIVKAPAKFKKYYYFMGILFGMLAYCYDPTYENDLARYFMDLDYCRMLSFSAAFDWADDGLIVKNLLFWLISKTGDNHLLPMLSMGIVYGVSAYICVDSVKDRLNKLQFLLLFQLTLLPFYGIVSNVRNVMAFALLILAVYRDLVQKKHNYITLLLYLLPCFIHMTGIVIVFIRLAIIIVKKHKYIGIFTTIFVPSTSVFIYERGLDLSFLPYFLKKIMERIIWKSYASFVNSSEYAVSMQNSGYFNSCRIILFVVGVTLLFLVLHQLKKKNYNINSYLLFVGLLATITLMFIVLGTVKYWVFAFAMLISCSPVLMEFITSTDLSIWKRQIVLIVLPLSMLGRSLLEFYFISSRINIMGYFYNFMTADLWLIIGNIIFGYIV